MAVVSSPLFEKECAAIDMNISMAVEELAEILHLAEEEVLIRFLESRTCATLYNEESKLWWEGPSAIAELYLEEIGFEKPDCE